MPDPTPPHTDTHDDCAACLVRPGRSRSEAIAWVIALLAVGLLVAVFFLGVGTSASTLLASGGFLLLATLLCPIVMGGMMWMMMRKH